VAAHDDLLVGTPATLYVGDLVEQGDHPVLEDSYPEEWTAALRQISALPDPTNFSSPATQALQRPVRQNHRHRCPLGKAVHP
jgi:hypothetical protein